MSILLEEKNAQEENAVPAAHRDVKLDDERTRITEWRFAPGAETGWHKHTHDYVTIHQSGGRLHLENTDGTEKFVDYEDGRTVAYQAPIEHNATNVSDVEVRVLEIEYK